MTSRISGQPIQRVRLPAFGQVLACFSLFHRKNHFEIQSSQLMSEFVKSLRLREKNNLKLIVPQFKEHLALPKLHQYFWVLNKQPMNLCAFIISGHCES